MAINKPCLYHFKTMSLTGAPTELIREYEMNRERAIRVANLVPDLPGLHDLHH